MRKVVLFAVLAITLALVTIPTARFLGVLIYTPKYLDRSQTEYLREDLRLYAELSTKCFEMGGYRFDEPNRCAIGNRWETLQKPEWFLERKLNPDYYRALWGTVGIVALLTIEFLGALTFLRLSYLSFSIWSNERKAK
jgi:hypothetical protein